MKDAYYLKTILKNITEGIIVINREGIITLFNEAVENFAGVSGEQALGRHLLEVFPHLNRDTSAFYKVLDSGEPLIDHIQTYINSKGKEVTIVTSVVPLVEEGELMGAMEVFRDFTQVEELSRKVLELQEQAGRPDEGDVEKGRGKMYGMEDFITESPSVKKILETAKQLASSHSPVLIYGETGTGKEILAQALHSGDPKRKNHPFIAQNCAALPKGLLESILFGSAAGGFTDAKERKGLFELAHGGTLFLDEINSMDRELQGKLLRVLEDGVIRRVGGTKTTQVNVRIIASTNENPKEAVREGKLREDLYYRLNVIFFSIPPLRERRMDIPVLTRNFIAHYNRSLGKKVKDVSPEVLDILMGKPWEGNVRELKYLLERIMNGISDKGIIGREDLPSEIEDQRKEEKPPGGEYKDQSEGSQPGGSQLFNEGFVQSRDEKVITTLPEALEHFEIRLIQEAIERAGGNRAQAARELGVPKQTLHNKIRKHGITWDVMAGRK